MAHNQKVAGSNPSPATNLYNHGDNLDNIKHVIENIHGIRPSISHHFLQNLEKFIKGNDLKYYRDIKNLFKFQDANDLEDVLSRIGKVVYTPVGFYIEQDNAMIVVDISVDDNDAGLYIHLEYVYNKDFDINKGLIQLASVLNDYKCKDTITKVVWTYKSGDYLESTSIYEINDVTIHQEAYPYIEEPIDSYVDRFLNSNETVLMMLGPAGTGKTKLIKYIMKYMAKAAEKSALLVKSKNMYDDDIFNRRVFSVSYSTSQESYNDDAFFIEFVKSDSRILILEDIDFNLRSRQDGNTFMHKLLNASDGIIELKKKKIIITTNLESEQKTDSALLRPGRTFDVLRTKPLNRREAEALAKVLGKELTIDKKDDKYSLAEIYNSKAEATHSMAFTV